MVRRYYNLPSLNTLAAFETAARNLSFKTAAAELNVTPGAVSHQIKALEAELGIILFHRKHRGVDLTERGELLHRALGRSFNDISTVLAFLRRPQDELTVTIAATSAVSSLWLAPRISKFWQEHEGVPINQITSDSELIPTENIDIRIGYGRIRDSSKFQEKLFKDYLVPVCSPEFAENISDISLTELAKQNLIHLDSDHSNWTSWHTWFAQLGYTGTITNSRKVNNYMIALQAAQDGAGIALGWQQLIDPLLEANKLVRLGTNVIEAPNSFYIISDFDELISPSALTVKNWLLHHI